MADGRCSDKSVVDILKATQQGAEPVRFGCRWGAYWRNLANTIELSVYVGDAALCQITLTTCFSIQTVYKHCLARTIRLKVLKSISLERYYVKIFIGHCAGLGLLHRICPAALNSRFAAAEFGSVELTLSNALAAAGK